VGDIPCFNSEEIVYSLIEYFGKWLLALHCACLRSWLEQGLPRHLL
jgi:hypothetical protein